MKFSAPREEKKWYSIGVVLMILSFAVFFGKTGCRNSPSKEDATFSKASTEKNL